MLNNDTPAGCKSDKFLALKRAVSNLSVPQLQPDQNLERLAIGIETVDAALQGGLLRSGLHEIRCSLSRDIGSATGYLMAILACHSIHHQGRILWVNTPSTRPDGGYLFPPGLRQLGLDPARLITICPTDFGAALWAFAEAARCSSLFAIVLHIKGNPTPLTLSASRQLLMRARQNGIFAWVLRQAGTAEASAVDTRWHIASAPSLAHPMDKKVIGNSRFLVSLERNRNGPLGQWTIFWNHNKKKFGHAPENTVSFIHQSAERPAISNSMGNILVFERAV